MRSRNKMHLMVNSFVSLAVVVFLAAIVTTVVRADGVDRSTYNAHRDVNAQQGEARFSLKRLAPRTYRHSVRRGMYDLELQGVGARFNGAHRGNGGMDVRLKVGYPASDVEAGNAFDTRIVTPGARLQLREPVGGPLFMFSIGKRW